MLVLIVWFGVFVYMFVGFLGALISSLFAAGFVYFVYYITLDVNLIVYQDNRSKYLWLNI